MKQALTLFYFTVGILLCGFAESAPLPPHILLELSDSAALQARTDESYLPETVLALQLPQADVRPVFGEPRNEKLRADWYAFGLQRFFRFTWSGEEFNAEAIGRELEKRAANDPAISGVTVSYPQEALDVPNDLTVYDMWGLNIMQCPQAWDVTHGDHAIIVTTIDTGCDIYHPDLAANIYVNPGEDLNHNGVWDASDNNNIDDDGNGFVDDLSGWDFVSHSAPGTPAEGEEYAPRDNRVYPDVNGHGTHVMGSAAGVTNNSVGVASASWNVSAMPLRAGFAWLNQGYLAGSGYSDDFAPAVQYAAEMGVRVVSISFGGSQADPTYEQAINFARANNVLIFGAAGNNNTSNRVYPGAYNAVIAVAATNRLDRKADFSSYGNWVDIAAPGVDIWSTLSSNIYHQEWYAAWAGTSMATPNAAAVASLVLSEYPDLTDDELWNIMLRSTDNIDAQNPNYTGFIGSGRVNALSALRRAAGNTLPSVEFAGNYMDHLSGTATLAWNFDPGQQGGFLRFRIYRDDVLIDSTVSNFTLQPLPALGLYRFGVTALFTAGESSPSNATFYWSGHYGLPIVENFEDSLSRWELMGQASTVIHPVFAGNSALRTFSNPGEFSGIRREFDGVAGVDAECWFRMANCPQVGGAAAGILFEGTNGAVAGCVIHSDPACVPATFVIPPYPPQVTVFDPAIVLLPDHWYKYRAKVIGPYLQCSILDEQHNAVLNGLAGVPQLDNVMRAEFLTISAQVETFFDNARLRPYTGGEISWFGFTETFNQPYLNVIDGATLDGVPLALGDEIGVYDGELCVGAEVVDGEYPVEINAWHATDTDPGYSAGHAIAYRVWSAALGEFTAIPQHQAGGSTFGDGVFSRVNLIATTQAADENAALSGKFALHDAFPNPFNPATTISFELPRSMQARLTIFNSLGQAVDVLFDRRMSRGTHRVVFHGEKLGSGIYFARLEAEGYLASQKLLLLK